MSEVELKFIVDKEAGEEVWGRAVALGHAAAEPPVRELESIYYDTPGKKLRRAGFSLRLRRDGDSWLQTVKYGRQLYGPLSRAGEIEARVPLKAVHLQAIGAAKLRRKLQKMIGDADLEPVCWTLINRRAGDIRLDDGSVAELALDTGLISAGDRSADFCEVEIELKAGVPRALYGLAMNLFPDGGLRFSRFSKAERGYLLAEKGVIEPPPAPRNAKAVPLGKNDTVETALRRTLRECIEQISQNIAAVAGSLDPAGAHQLRIGLRRLRSLFVVFSPALDDSRVRRLKAESRWLFAEAGKLRDIEAVIEDVVGPLAAENPEEAGFDRLIEELGRQAATRRAKLRALIADGRTQAFLLDLSLLAETLGEKAPGENKGDDLLSKPLGKFAAGALDRRWSKTLRRAERLAELGIGGRHELRKALKRLRYSAEFFAPLYGGKQVRAFLGTLKALQQVLGDMLDAQTAHDLFRDAGLLDDPDPELQRAIGWVLGAGRAGGRLGRKRVEALWTALSGTKPFWR